MCRRPALDQFGLLRLENATRRDLQPAAALRAAPRGSGVDAGEKLLGRVTGPNRPRG
jgi:hypothetical protein